MCIVLSEVALDRDRVIDKLSKMMDGFEGMLASQLKEDEINLKIHLSQGNDESTFSRAPKPVVVMMGSFNSKNNVHTGAGRAIYRGGWERLEKIITARPLMVGKNAAPLPVEIMMFMALGSSLSSNENHGSSRRVVFPSLASNVCRPRAGPICSLRLRSWFQ